MTTPLPTQPMPPEKTRIQLILVPAGAEYQAVKRAINRVQNGPQVVAIPAGPQAVQRFFETWQSPLTGGVLLMGLGGSLSTHYNTGDGVLLETVWPDEVAGAIPYNCDRPLTQWLAQQLTDIALGTGVTCNHVITTAAEKRQLRDRYGADVVDMEGAALLQALPNCPIAILRVISDDCHHDLPDLSTVIGADGTLKPIPLTLSFLQQPLAALRLIRGSLKGLQTLEQLTVELCQSRREP